MNCFRGWAAGLGLKITELVRQARQVKFGLVVFESVDGGGVNSGTGKGVPVGNKVCCLCLTNPWQE